eukprot:Hpha_TRINITY_DN16150_c1_g4::TRINITY_DN16150_c1_g4_i1::g.3590::m.3590
MKAVWIVVLLPVVVAGLPIEEESGDEAIPLERTDTEIVFEGDDGIEMQGDDIVLHLDVEDVGDLTGDKIQEMINKRLAGSKGLRNIDSAEEEEEGAPDTGNPKGDALGNKLKDALKRLRDVFKKQEKQGGDERRDWGKGEDDEGEKKKKRKKKMRRLARRSRKENSTHRIAFGYVTWGEREFEFQYIFTWHEWRALSDDVKRGYEQLDGKTHDVREYPHFRRMFEGYAPAFWSTDKDGYEEGVLRDAAIGLIKDLPTEGEGESKRELTHHSWPGGSTYNGEVAQGAPDGDGVVTWAGTHSDVGESDIRLPPRPSHLGPSHCPAGECPATQYSGGFLDGLPHGYGIYNGPDGRYEGEWVAGYRFGRGKAVWPDGREYAGDWEEG